MHRHNKVAPFAGISGALMKVAHHELGDCSVAARPHRLLSITSAEASDSRLCSTASQKLCGTAPTHAPAMIPTTEIRQVLHSPTRLGIQLTCIGELFQAFACTPAVSSC